MIKIDNETKNCFNSVFMTGPESRRETDPRELPITQPEVGFIEGNGRWFVDFTTTSQDPIEFFSDIQILSDILSQKYPIESNNPVECKLMYQTTSMFESPRNSTMERFSPPTDWADNKIHQAIFATPIGTFSWGRYRICTVSSKLDCADEFLEFIKEHSEEFDNEKLKRELEVAGKWAQER